MVPLYILHLHLLSLAREHACYRVFVSAVKTQIIPKAFVCCHEVCDNLSDIAFRSGGVSLTVLAHDDSRTARGSEAAVGLSVKSNTVYFPARQEGR